MYSCPRIKGNKKWAKLFMDNSYKTILETITAKKLFVSRLKQIFVYLYSLSIYKLKEKKENYTDKYFLLKFAILKWLQNILVNKKNH